jgi:hypothetical protein
MDDEMIRVWSVKDEDGTVHSFISRGAGHAN